MVATRDIKYKEAIFGVPLSLLISVNTVKKDKELYDMMVSDCPTLFTEEMCYDYEVLSMTLFLMCEHVKGEDSDYYPFMQCLPDDCAFFCDWDREVINECQDKEMLKVVEEYRSEVDMQGMVMSAFMLRHVKYFLPVISEGQ